jgi:hypothetical protein
MEAFSKKPDRKDALAELQEFEQLLQHSPDEHDVKALLGDSERLIVIDVEGPDLWAGFYNKDVERLKRIQATFGGYFSGPARDEIQGVVFRDDAVKVFTDACRRTLDKARDQDAVTLYLLAAVDVLVDILGRDFNDGVVITWHAVIEWITRRYAHEPAEVHSGDGDPSDGIALFVGGRGAEKASAA